MTATATRPGASSAFGWSVLNTVLSRLGTLGIGIMLARVLGPDGTPVMQADLASANYTVYRLDASDPDAETPIAGHTSRALADAIGGVERPAVEVHISDVFQREPWRHELVLESVVIGQVIGRGWEGYLEAIDLLLDREPPA